MLVPVIDLYHSNTANTSVRLAYSSSQFIRGVDSDYIMADTEEVWPVGCDEAKTRFGISREDCQHIRTTTPRIVADCVDFLGNRDQVAGRISEALGHTPGIALIALRVDPTSRVEDTVDMLAAAATADRPVLLASTALGAPNSRCASGADQSVMTEMLKQHIVGRGRTRARHCADPIMWNAAATLEVRDGVRSIAYHVPLSCQFCGDAPVGKTSVHGIVETDDLYSDDFASFSLATDPPDDDLSTCFRSAFGSAFIESYRRSTPTVDRRTNFTLAGYIEHP